ncbi:hypothetical protein V2J09_002416 [Rumex salicifolius]
MEVGRFSCQKDLVPFVAMVMVECTNVGLNVLYKAASLKGMSFYVFIVYSYVVATLFLLPCLFIFNRNVELPVKRSPLMCRIFLLGLTGFVAQVCQNSGIMYSSPTLASAMSNLVPAFTFILAIIFRMEKVTWRCISTQAKIMGTALSIAGACVVTLYKSTSMDSTSSQTSILHFLPWGNALNFSVSDWVIGAFLLAAEYLFLSITYIIQGQILKGYPAELHLVFYYNTCVMVLSFMAGLVMETELSAWKLRLDVELATILYSGILVSSVCTVIHTWGLHLKGPFYIALFRPMSIAIAAIMSAVIISVGFYIVLWGKAKEEIVIEETANLGYSPKETRALLSSKIMKERVMEGVRRRRMRFCCNELLPFTVMVAIECSNVVLNTIFKAASIKNGLTFYVFVTYSYSVAALVLLPYNFLFRKIAIPSLSLRILGKFFVLSLVGSSCQITGYRGIEYSSPTLCSALSNLIPAFTFILAIIFRMERFNWRSFSFQAKIIGTIVSVSGALIVIFYKGPAIILYMQKSPSTLQSSLDSLHSNWVLGGILLVSSHLLSAIWYIIMTDIIKEFPAKLVVVFFNCFFGAMICGTVGFVFESNPSAWLLKLDLSLAAVLYSGLLGSFLSNSVHVWAIHLKGPVYVAMFKPLSIAIAAAMGVMFLGDTLYLGSIIGAIVISLGFYGVMWGKTTEEMVLKSLIVKSKGYAIELYFDPALEDQALRSWNALVRRQITTQLIEMESRPHITLFSSSSQFLDRSKLGTLIKKLATKHEPLNLTFYSIGCLTGGEGNVLFLSHIVSSPVPFIALRSTQKGRDRNWGRI